jgi:hypothetical protein
VFNNPLSLTDPSGYGIEAFVEYLYDVGSAVCGSACGSVAAGVGIAVGSFFAYGSASGDWTLQGPRNELVSDVDDFTDGLPGLAREPKHGVALGWTTGPGQTISPTGRLPPSTREEAVAVAGDAYDRWWNARPRELRIWGPLSNVKYVFSGNGAVCIDFATACASGLNDDASFREAGLFAEGTWQYWREAGYTGNDFRVPAPPPPRFSAHADVWIYWAPVEGGPPEHIETFDPWWRLW